MYFVIGIAVYVAIGAWSLGYFSGRYFPKKDSLRESIDADHFTWIMAALWIGFAIWGLIDIVLKYIIFKHIMMPIANWGFKFGKRIKNRLEDKKRADEAVALIVQEIDEDLKPKPIQEPPAIKVRVPAPGWIDDKFDEEDFIRKTGYLPRRA